MSYGIEIMSPVGSYESLMAAIQGGANSVYFGIENLNMRSRSSNNFTLNDLVKISEICKTNNVRSYITLNTIIYDDELDLMRTIVDKAKECNITAIIASDMSVIEYAYSKGVEVHISTQCNITNIEAVRFFSRYADVIVTARELSLKQVNNIVKAIEKENIKGPSGKLMQVEVFAHGALCMAVSGKCYLSLHTQNYSANRGACLQPCRREYTVSDKEENIQLDIDNEYIMSPKDLCTIGFLDKILKAGVKVLKIEGRGRSPEYVKTTTAVYREAVNACFEGNYNETNIKVWEEKLKTVFNRGFWDGYYLGRKLGEWTEKYGNRSEVRKVYIGKGMNYFSDIKVAEFKVETESISVGDKIIITGPTTGVIEAEVKEIRVDLKPVQTANKGEFFSMPVDDVIRRADKLYKVVNVEDADLE